MGEAIGVICQRAPISAEPSNTIIIDVNVSPSKEDEEKEDKFSGLFLSPPSFVLPRLEPKKERVRSDNKNCETIKTSSDTEAN